MSELVQNLSHIYNIKLQIKDVLGTDSDLFEEYPDLIEEAIGEGGGGSATPVDPWYGKVFIQDMVENEETTADYYSSCINDNLRGDDINAAGEKLIDEPEDMTAWGSLISWDEIAEFEENGDTVEKIVRVEFKYQIGQTLPNGTLIDDYYSGVNTYVDLYPELYGNIFPILQDVTLTESSDPSNDGYDYLIQGDIYAFNLFDCCGGIEEITENDLYITNGSQGVDVNVPSGGLSEGTYNIFNFLAYGLQYGMFELNNKPYEEINLYNLGPINYFDPMNGMDTKNQYVEMNLWDNSQMDTEVEFENVTGDATSDGGDHWYQFNELSQSSEADEFMVVHIDVYDWVYDLDPDTGMDAGYWEVSDTYIAVFENTYGVDGDGDGWTYTIRFYYDNNNNEWVVDLYQNGVLVEEGVSAHVQQ